MQPLKKNLGFPRVVPGFSRGFPKVFPGFSKDFFFFLEKSRNLEATKIIMIMIFFLLWLSQLDNSTILEN